MANNRIFYAIQQVGIKPDGEAGDYNALFGVQSVGMNTNFNLEQVFEYGQTAIYENIEDIPDVELTVSKVLDGSPLIYHRATQNALAPDLLGRSNEKCLVALAVFNDTSQSAVGTPPSIMESSGCYLSSETFTFSVDGNFTEEASFVSNDKVWKGDTKIQETDALARRNALTFDGDAAFANNSHGPTGKGGVNRRENILFAYNGSVGVDVNGQVADPDATILPTEIYGISSSGTNEFEDGQYGAHVQSITVSFDLGRESINELGRRGPYHRFASSTVEVSTEIEVIAVSGDMISATEKGVRGTGTGSCDEYTNLVDQTIRIATCEGTRIYLGTKNKLQSVGYNGGDTGGGNVSVTYSYVTFNTCTVLHENDPNSKADTWWTNRADYLTTTA